MIARHYTFKRDDIKAIQDDSEYKQLKQRFDKLIRQDQFIDLTLTYDFDNDEASQVHQPLLPTTQKGKLVNVDALLPLS